jgi:hypothetical protein
MLRKALSAALTAVGALSCARVEPPPGGPLDAIPPRLVGTRPDSLAVLPDFSGDVEFVFDEVVSEGGQPSQGFGTGDLERLVLLSPSNRVPEVRWHRSRITVRPREGWQPNRVYRVELLPGVTDLRNNRGDNRAVVTFSTGGAVPNVTLSGKVNDWTTGRPAAQALVEAVLQPDSLVYRAVADSSGAFRLGPLPAGTYLVYGAIDQNRNLRREGREIFDSVRVGPDKAEGIALWAFPHDTVGPRIQTVTLLDSLSATLAFTQPLDPRQRLGPSAVHVRRLPDSTAIPVRTLLTQAAHDSAYRPAAPVDTSRARDSAAVRDTARARDSLRARPPAGAGAAPERPPLNDRLVLRVAEPLQLGGRYVIDVDSVRNVSGAVSSPRATLAVPARPKPAAADSTRRPGAPDSAPKPPVRDTTRPPGRQ